jgi:hypothetical protein
MVPPIAEPETGLSRATEGPDAMRRALIGSDRITERRLSSVLDLSTGPELSRLHVNRPRFSSTQVARRLDSSRVPSRTQVA